MVLKGFSNSHHDFRFPEAVFLTSRFGNPVIQIGNYRFSKWSGSTGAKTRWICIKDHKGCRAKLWTYDEVIIKYHDNHNH
ncbi:unnamed protein product [Parnassius mnemosyne]|uniref:FLYWCH-type domain-containing protein n=1 Tax=Parnassius mnemosyne TaxID=213953 RepID=A0AAV1KAR1_9NEOP